MSKLLKLAKQGEASAIATLLGDKLEAKGIWVIAQRQGDALDLIFEALQIPPQTAITQFVARGMRSLQPIGLRKLVLHGRSMGESADAWQATLPLQFIAPPEPEPEAPEPISPPQPTPQVADIVDPRNLKPTSDNALVAAAQQGQKGAISGLLAREFRRDNVIVRTILRGTCLQVNLSGATAPEQDHYVEHVLTMVQNLQLSFVEQLHIQGWLRGQNDPLWTVKVTVGDQPPTSASHQPLRRLDLEGRNCLAWGLGLATVIFLVPLSRFILSYFVILVHELGHAVPAWLFGYLAIPTFNFLHGGGLTIPLARMSLVTTLIIGGLAYLCYVYRRNVRTQQILGIVLLVYCLFNLTPLHNIVVIAMGHGGEVVTIALCFYFTFGKYFCFYPGERTLFAMLGWFTLFNVLFFSGRLILSPSFRAEYLGGIGGMLDNDLVILANDYHLFGVMPLAGLLMLLSLLAPGVAWLTFRYEQHWFTVFMGLIVRDKAKLS